MKALILTKVQTALHSKNQNRGFSPSRTVLDIKLQKGMIALAIGWVQYKAQYK